ncbi:thymidine phosphorylase [Ruminococcus sp.]|uniref:thymidine phosphorylase n=1 Tax=Ruminococcus sp. TaxID=41978 RepID=UPI0025F014DC|nr:thymidine phosphorylase [Ruminococcus sp.]MCR4637883.1 thymidine phosphorylase [Ruminococcus sp.]
MNIIDIINKTKKSQELNEEEILWLIKSYTNDEIPDYQMSAWLMAVCLNGLSEKETFALTAAMRDSGEILNLNIPFTVDKHSTGGVGDKTSLIIGPIVAACGVCMAKMSGRGLGHTGGTIDKLESIEGYRTDLPLNEFESILKKTGFSIISQSGEFCPADKKMYALRNATGTVDSIPLICASIMSKKLAMNADCLVLDVKYGTGAFMKTKEEAEKLAVLMEKAGRSAGKKCKAVVTDMNAPLGKNIGNALEVKEAVELLQGKSKGKLYDVCIELAVDLLELAGKGTNEECRKMAEDAVSSGKALNVLRETIRLQGGNEKICYDTSLLPQPLLKYEIRATTGMKILGFNCEELGMTSLLLGAGRLNKTDKIDMSAGIVMNCDIGDQLATDDIIMTLYSTVCSDFSDAAVRALNAVKFKINEKPSYT